MLGTTSPRSISPTSGRTMIAVVRKVTLISITKAMSTRSRIL